MVNNNELIESLNYRYATKKFDTEKQISTKDKDTIKEILKLTPTSFGMQPYKFLIVNDKKIKKELVEKSYYQNQVLECDFLLVICIDTKLDDKFIDNYISSICKIRNQKKVELEKYEIMLKNFFKNKTQIELEEWAIKQTYIVLGNIMTALSLMKLDSCPMEGFVKKEYDEILNLKEKGLKSSLVLPIGYRHKEDKYQNLKKVRFETKDLFEEINE